MATAYWIGQFVAVALCYAFVMFLWPLVVFHNILKDKSRTFCFGFCTCGMVLFINLAVLSIGLIPHALHGWLVAVLFYGIFAVSVWRQIRQERKRRAGTAVLHLIGGTIGWRSFLLSVLGTVPEALRFLGRKVKRFFQGHRTEYGILLFLCAYAVVYFGWGAVDARYYGFGDMYVHHSWIDGLQSGEIFSSGIYPEGMHTFIYVMNCVSGIRVYSILLFLGPIHSIILIVSMWIFLKEIFHWKFSADLAILLFLILEQNSINDIYSMSRIQWTIPQEFALFTEFLCGVFLLRFLKDGALSLKKPIKNWFRILWNEENLLLFVMAVAASFATHFYVTIMAAILCAGVVLSRLYTFFQKGRWREILIGAILAVVIALVPMAGAFAEGTPLQGSLGWAVKVMQGHDPDSETQEGETEESATQTTEETAQPNETNAHARHSRSGLTQTIGKLSGVWESGFETIYGDRKGKVFAVVTVFVFIASLFYKIIAIFAKNTFSGINTEFMDGPLAISLTAALFMLDYIATDIDLPQLIAGARILTSERIYVLAVCVTVIDLVFTKLFSKVTGPFQNAIGIVAVPVLYLLVIVIGQYHGYLYYEQSRYTEAAEITSRIISEIDSLSYTIVSPTDELYQVKNYGYHEELLTLVKSVDSNKNYTIPSRYIFVFIEKKPILYGQTHFFRGPVWLAVNGKNTRPYKHYNLQYSEDPDAVSGSISSKEAEKALQYEIGEEIPGEDHEARIIMESKAMHWINEFKKYYPHDIRTYYEDDNFVCYEIRQDPQIPYRLSVLVDTND